SQELERTIEKLQDRLTRRGCVALEAGEAVLELLDRALELLGVLDKLLDRLGLRVFMVLDYCIGREAFCALRAGIFDDLARNSHDRGASWDSLHDHRVGPDPRP